MTASVGYSMDDLYQEAQYRWLKPAEVLYILQNHENCQITQQPRQRPSSGSLFLFNKRVLRNFRRDGHNWRKKKDQRTVGEAHERLKVGNVEKLNCYYAHGEDNPNFQRRSYWMLDPACDHIVLVHYRDITEGKHSSGSKALFSPGSSSAFSRSLSPSPYSIQNQGSASLDSCQTQSSPSPAEVTSVKAVINHGMDNLDRVEGAALCSSSDLNMSKALRRIEEQLSLNDDTMKEIDPLFVDDEYFNSVGFLDCEREISQQDQHEALLHVSDPVNCQFLSENNGVRDVSSDYMPHKDTDDNGQHRLQAFEQADLVKVESFEWTEMESFLSSSANGSLEQSAQIPNENEKLHSFTETGPAEGQEGYLLSDATKNRDPSASLLLSELDNFQLSVYPSTGETHGANPEYYPVLFGQGQPGMSVVGNSCLTVAKTQKFTIEEISPEWGYTTEATKIVIVGSFLCDPSESGWSCMFGDIEVPVKIIQQGVIRCEAPPHLPGKVTLCIISSNRQSCSEVREFEYRVKSNFCAHCNLEQTEVARHTDELLLLVRFVQMLLCDSAMQKEDGVTSGIHVLRNLKAEDDSWSHIIEGLLVGHENSSETTNWLLQELLKDKLQQWVAFRSRQEHDQGGCSLSKKEQGIIHMIAGLGFEWALNSILGCGVNVNFRDINGCTALHWAARFGREKMVAALVASGASAGAVTDPNCKDPAGKTPASIASSSGHKGLAGYLSELALTSHLSSLTLEESELSRGSAELEAERTINSITNQNLTSNEDQLSLQDTLAAVRNAAQAAARIQSAFRAHSFRKRQQMDAAVADYGISSGDIQGFTGMLKLSSRNARDHNSAALSIQKKYRGWKGRKDFLTFRQKVVKIQAHVRGYQVRKHYKVLCWAVGILDKVVLRWRRKGVGLRSFQKETESIEDSDDEDILKVFRKQKVDAAVDEAVSRVLSMVDSPNARQQYRRMLERYRQAKAELDSTSSEAAPSPSVEFSNMDDDDFMYQFP
ncbi:calmodulin-binding transcription activator 4 isoform X1 [Syzygium oleosum]|uniref:calmodulin-binding transcription activator 4 isoform X1 n=1 Tax=Syzygium oleosum TaxID=219896 RepID=UPI0011D222EB|nr:calmodulin-binding transcription activator 4 isoform X1 [Syzygium oleosum]XP_056168239.1 calmodulin-binding transcription activator 4 isoform X1 [Syzygium oleosum]